MSNVVSIRQCARILAKQIQTRGPNVRALIQGAPGVAKSSVVRQLVPVIGYKHLVDERLAQKAPEDISGYPFTADGVMRLNRPAWFPTESKTVLFLDEIAQAKIEVQNAGLQLVLDRRSGPHVLPEDCIIIAACNRPEDRAGANSLTTALLSRFNVILTIEPEMDEVCDYFVQQGRNAYTIAWMKSQLESPLDFDPRKKGGFVCPRTLEELAILTDCYAADSQNPDFAACAHGLIGSDNASNYLAFLQTVTQIPSYADMVADPENTRVLDDMVEPVAKQLANNGKFAHVPKLLRYVERYHPENQVVILRQLQVTLTHPEIEQKLATLAP